MRILGQLALAAIAALSATPAAASVTYPAASTDTACVFGSGSSTIDTTALNVSGAGAGLTLAADGSVAVLDCGSLSVASGANVRVQGMRGLEIRVRDTASIEGTLDAAAHGSTGGPGAAMLVNPDGSAGNGFPGGAGGSGTNGGAGATYGGGGGGGGYAGGGGGGTVANSSSLPGGNGGGATPGAGGTTGGEGGHHGVGGPAGATDGQAGGFYGGGGGGGAFGAQGPFHPGSGGGGGASEGLGGGAGAAGGGGGGALRIVAATSITVSGSGLITVDGAPGGGGAYGNGGGGSGGGLELIAPQVLASGSGVSARGGIGGLTDPMKSAGGNGGPGRVDVVANSASSLASVPAATVTPYSYTLSTSASGSGSGVITSDPAGISCGPDCAEEFNPGTPVTLHAAPGTGSTFDGWAGACTNTTGDCTVTLDQARAVTATFTQRPADITTGDGAGAGSADPPPSGEGQGQTPLPAVVTTLSLTGRARQSVARTRKLIVTVGSSLSGKVSVSGTLTIGRRRLELGKQTRSVTANGKVLVTFRLSKALARRVGAARRRHTAVAATVSAAPVSPLVGKPVSRKIQVN